MEGSCKQDEQKRCLEYIKEHMAVYSSQHTMLELRGRGALTICSLCWAA